MTEMTPDGVPDYHSRHAVPYKEPEGISYTSLEVLDFLKGLPWDNLALGYVHSLRPSCIRVTRGECTLDARTWRVTVVVDENDIIQEITHEVAVGLYGWQHGAALREELVHRLEGGDPRDPGEHDWSDKSYHYCPYIPQFGLEAEDEIAKALVAEVEQETPKTPTFTLLGIESMKVYVDPGLIRDIEETRND
jgi:hypothetical protein